MVNNLTIRPLVLVLTVLGGIQRRLDREQSGATAVEYGLLVGLIAVAIIIAVTAFGTKLSALFTSLTGKLPTIA